MDFAVPDTLGTEYVPDPAQELLEWATLEAPALEAAWLAAYRPLSLAESDWRRPSTLQLAAALPFWNPTDNSGGVVLLLQQAEAPAPDAPGHFSRNAGTYGTIGGVAALLLVADQAGVFDSGSDKPATLIQQEAGRDANVIVGSGNTSNQGDTAPPPVPVPEP